MGGSAQLPPLVTPHRGGSGLPTRGGPAAKIEGRLVITAKKSATTGRGEGPVAPGRAQARGRGMGRLPDQLGQALRSPGAGTVPGTPGWRPGGRASPSIITGGTPAPAGADAGKKKRVALVEAAAFGRWDPPPGPRLRLRAPLAPAAVDGVRTQPPKSVPGKRGGWASVVPTKRAPDSENVRNRTGRARRLGEGVGADHAAAAVQAGLAAHGHSAFGIGRRPDLVQRRPQPCRSSAIPAWARWQTGRSP